MNIPDHPIETLDSIAIRRQTDRASQFTRTWGKPHGFARHYDKLFSELRFNPVKLLEIGSASGEGIQMWMDYFHDPDAKFFGVDKVANTCDWNTPGFFETGRYFFNHADQSDQTFWKCFVVNHGTDFDIIIDDGSHFNDDILASFNAMWSHVKPGGFYAIEDLGVCIPGSIFVRGGPTHLEFINDKVKECILQKSIDSIYCANELVVLRKAL